LPFLTHTGVLAEILLEAAQSRYSPAGFCQLGAPFSAAVHAINYHIDQ
jgi:hypothetical protein